MFAAGGYSAGSVEGTMARSTVSRRWLIRTVLAGDGDFRVAGSPRYEAAGGAAVRMGAPSGPRPPLANAGVVVLLAVVLGCGTEPSRSIGRGTLRRTLFTAYSRTVSSTEARLVGLGRCTVDAPRIASIDLWSSPLPGLQSTACSGYTSGTGPLQLRRRSRCAILFEPKRALQVGVPASRAARARTTCCCGCATDSQSRSIARLPFAN